jgi:hypothetical protein
VTVWAVGESNQPNWRDRWCSVHCDGGSWVKARTGFSDGTIAGPLFGVAVPDAQDVWVVGRYNAFVCQDDVRTRG